MSIEHRQSNDLSRDAAALDVFASEGGRQPSDVARETLELGVEREGLDYYYKGYRYERLADALAYARLRRSTPAEELAAPSTRRNPLAAPNDADWALMSSLGIRFDGRAFRVGGYRYDRLNDAVSSARRANGGA